MVGDVEAMAGLSVALPSYLAAVDSPAAEQAVVKAEMERLIEDDKKGRVVGSLPVDMGAEMGKHALEVREGESLWWCELMSVLVGLADAALVILLILLFVWLKGADASCLKCLFGKLPRGARESLTRVGSKAVLKWDMWHGGEAAEPRNGWLGRRRVQIQ